MVKSIDIGISSPPSSCIPNDNFLCVEEEDIFKFDHMLLESNTQRSQYATSIDSVLALSMQEEQSISNDSLVCLTEFARNVVLEENVKVISITDRQSVDPRIKIDWVHSIHYIGQ